MEQAQHDKAASLVIGDVQASLLDLQGKLVSADPTAAALIGAAIASLASANGWTQKQWGLMQRIYSDDRLEVARIRIRAGGYCSLHKHVDKINVFIVTSGFLQVTVWPENGNFETIAPGDTHFLATGSPPLIVPQGRWHRFFTNVNTEVVEVYYPFGGAKVREGEHDIVRRSEGGISPMKMDAVTVSDR